MELTTEDRQRIEQEAKHKYRNTDDAHIFKHFCDDFKAGAEYATLYERQQQAELRNKVIEECIEQLKDTREGDMIVRLLNSLKTK